MNSLWIRCGLLALSLSALAWAAGCAGPLDRDADMVLREQVIGEYRARLAAVADAGAIRTQREPSDVEAELTDDRRQELDRLSGSEAYGDDPLMLGRDLKGRRLAVEIEAEQAALRDQLRAAEAGEPTPPGFDAEQARARLDELDAELAGRTAQTVEIALLEAVRMAVQNNLEVRFARLAPAIGQAQLVQARAAFDATFFTNVDWTKLDTPQPPGAIAGISGDVQAETLELETGIRQRLTTGGQVALANTLTYNEQVPSISAANDYWDNSLALSINQPLLRGFGADVNTAQIVLTENARARAVQELRQQLLQTVLDTEQTYWRLELAIQQLLIQQRLYERTIDDRDRLIKRRDFDVSPVRITEANSFVELRHADVIRARQRVRTASDALKRLINSEDLPVAGETLLIPTNKPGEEAIDFSLLDMVLTALRQRPELEAALLSIHDATVRQRVADNARLPLLDVSAAVAYSGLDVDKGGDAFLNTYDGDYIDYILGAQFEQPIGNRAAQGLYAQRQRERRQAVLAYQQAAQGVVVEVKTAMRNVMTAYELIGATRAARRAAADSLRAIDEQERAGVALTPEFLLDLKLQTQQRLADAEFQEAQAIVDYNNAIAELYRTTGTLLERNHIVFSDE